MNFLKFILTIFIINSYWFITDACQSSSEDEKEHTTRVEIQTKEGCILKDGSPFCLHNGECYRIPSRKKPNCICYDEWWGRRCNIFETDYNSALDKEEDERPWNYVTTTPKIRFTIPEWSREGCILDDGSPFCLHDGYCYRVPKRNKPNCTCEGKWWGRRCNILRTDYNPRIDREEDEYLK
ncbi:hypothetical protein PVAND_008928 [Polypedilum vanderplanki]|uniref:EGF-like domain-containing protein n=1 Tax=Polypedilum vanderplanki TaxID=319348 RepID=A0A9J6CCK7_POLVA|nr:hypothetical protein PVAND_008928 [Polypedilum vanderplanki]